MRSNQKITKDLDNLPAPSISARNIVKDYPGVRALDKVNLDLYPGEIHALIGENGAGKSTLIKLLSGDVQPDSGEILLDGIPIVFGSPGHARDNGIVTIFQELAIVPGISVAENIVLGNEPCRGAGNQFVDRNKVLEIARTTLKSLNCDKLIDPSAPASELSAGQKQVVEIARALALGAPVIILDEPTASLSSNEVDALLDLLVRLKDSGTAILYVSHRLEEIMQIADRISVLRNGEYIGTYLSENVNSTDELIKLMIGKNLSELFPPRNTNIGENVLRISNFQRSGVFEDINFELASGEILGLAGLVGAGRTEIMRALIGADPKTSGKIFVKGILTTIDTPVDAIRHGIAYIPEDRKDQGLVLNLNGFENIVLGSVVNYQKFGMISWSKARNAADAMSKKLQFKGQLSKTARTNSGGNQQKLVIGKWVLAKTDILIFDEPTRGIDVGAKTEIYRLIQDLAAQGKAIIVVSSEIPELTNLCHRILTVSKGRICDEIALPNFDEHRILTAAFSGHV